MPEKTQQASLSEVIRNIVPSTPQTEGESVSALHEIREEREKRLCDALQKQQNRPT